MGKTDPFNAEYVPILLGLGIGLLLALASITEFVLSLDSLKKISGTVSRVEHNTFEYRSNRGLSGTYKNISVWLKGKQSSFGITGMDIDTKDIESIEQVMRLIFIPGTGINHRFLLTVRGRFTI